ncbi:hypothetical protein GGH91_000548 [Coemansia sp. RSA 2671]|nr:hypothetical protein GGH91_000548 [Coemansia sp. RSA 2671]
MCKRRRIVVVGLFVVAGPPQRSIALAGDHTPDRYGHVVSQPTAYTAVFASLFGVFIAYILVTYSAFVYRARYLRDKSLLDRSVFLLSAQTLSGSLFACSALIRGFIPNFPCFVDLWLLSLGYIMWFTTITLYMARYYVVARLHRSIATEQRVNPVTPDNLVEYMRRLRVATQGAFWRSSADDFGAAAGANQQSVDNQVKDERPSLIGRVLSWRRPEANAGGTESDTRTSQPGRGQLSFDLELESTADEVALDVAASDSEHADTAFSLGSASRQTARKPSNALREERLNDKWTRRCQSNKFASYVLLGMFVAVVGYLALLSTLFTRLKLDRLYYNCFRGSEYIAQSAITGTFNVIIQPAYMVIIWKYHDAYGIRNLMCFTCAMGVVCWAGILTWRVNKNWSNIFISSYVGYIFQMVFVYTCYAVIPLINSIRFSYSRRAGHQQRRRQQEQHRLGRRMSSSMGLDMEHGSAQYDPDDLFQAANDSVKRKFLEDMRNADKHEEVKRFAALCFCTELVSFLDVLQAFKNCVYQDMLASVSRPLSSVRLADGADPGATTEPQSVANTGSTQSPSQSAARSTNNKSARSSESRAAASPRTSIVVGRSKLAQAIFNRDSLKAVLRPKRKAPGQANRHDAGDTTQTSANLKNLAAGIAKTMAQAFPDQGISRDTEFSESLREPLSALIDTFILPESSLALNVPGNIVRAARSYLGGGTLSYSTIDQVGAEAINLLYSNVYVRYRQL